METWTTFPQQCLPCHIHSPFDMLYQGCSSRKNGIHGLVKKLLSSFINTHQITYSRMVNHSNIATSSELVQSKVQGINVVVLPHALQVSHADFFPLVANDEIMLQPVLALPSSKHCLCSIPILGDTVSSFGRSQHGGHSQEVTTAFLALLTGLARDQKI